ncbi:MAG: zinc-ribbon domain-containing protein [Lachnospiraceae bacterium]|nr:zinc-ribbon domain-containing protein [Lachnospiraceae bacterium]
MSFCMRCGKQNPDGTMFCTGCGFQMNQGQNVPVQNVPVQNVPVQNIPVQNIPAQNVPVQNIPAQNVPVYNIPAQNVPVQNVPVQNIPAQNVPVQNIPAQNIPVQNIPVQNSPVQQNYAASPAPAVAGAPAPEKKKNKALLWIIIGACCAVAAIVVGIILIATNKKHSGAQGALDNYFEAVNNLDRRAVYACCHTDMSGYKEEGTTTRYFTREYTKSHLASMDFLFFDKNVAGPFLRSYGYQGDYTDMNEYIEMREEYNNDNIEDNTSKTMEGFEVSYKLNKMKDATKCRFSYSEGLRDIQVDNVKEWLEKKIDETTEEIKFANITIEWKYGDKLYGYDKNWWSQEGIKDTIVQSRDYKTYESTIRACQEYATCNVLLYKVRGNWYIYPEHILKANAAARWKVIY